MNIKKNRKKFTIGFSAIADFRSIIGQDILNGIIKASEDFNVNLINFVGPIRYSLKDDIEFFNHYKKKFKYINHHNLDGFISWASSFQAIIPESEIELLHMETAPLPMVTIGMRIGNYPCIFLDNKQGIEKALTHLIDHHKYKNIGFFGCKGRRQYVDRLNFFIEILKNKNLEYNSKYTVILDDLDRKSLKKALSELIYERGVNIKKEVQAIICVSDLIARMLIEELEILGINIPNDIAVIGFNNQLESIRTSPSITTINPHFFNFGYKAVEILISMINGKEVEKSILMPCELIIRQSCGCFEDLILNTEIKYNEKKVNKENDDIITSQTFSPVIDRITEIFKMFNPSFSKTNTKELLENFINDITGKTNHTFLNAIKKYFFDFKNISEEKQIIWQSIISEFRNLILPCLGDKKNYAAVAENIFHQTRVMIDIANSYFIFSKRADVYKLGLLARIATDFANVVDKEKILELIKNNITELEIPSVYLFLFKEIKEDIGDSSLFLAYNWKEEEELSGLKFTFFPKGNIGINKFLKTKRKSFVFELLHFKDTYIGFVLFEMGPNNIPLYDIIKTILSPSLYTAIVITDKMDEIKERELLLKNKIIIEILKKEKGIGLSETKSLTATKIIEYLSDHINEVTNLEKFSRDLHCSKSTLVRKTKQLTGYSIQKLHEILKIEKSKILLKNKNISIQEIADRVGFQNQYYFSNVFKKHTGLSPKRWAQLNIK